MTNDTPYDELNSTSADEPRHRITDAEIVPGFYSVKAAADAWGMTPDAVTKQRLKEAFEWYDIGRSIVIPEDEVHRYNRERNKSGRPRRGEKKRKRRLMTKEERTAYERRKIPGYSRLREAAERWNLSERGARDVVYRGDVAAYRVGGGLLIPDTEVSAFNRNRRPPGRPPDETM